LLDCFVAYAPRNDEEVTVPPCDRHAATPRNGDVASLFPSLRLPRRYALYNDEEVTLSPCGRRIAVSVIATATPPLLAMTKKGCCMHTSKAHELLVLAAPL
jgi:hypothetical protein